MITYFYEYIYIYFISMSIFKRLSRFDLEIHKVGHQGDLVVNGDIISH
jgi:hypothetical protein